MKDNGVVPFVLPSKNAVFLTTFHSTVAFVYFAYYLFYFTLPEGSVAADAVDVGVA